MLGTTPAPTQTQLSTCDSVGGWRMNSPAPSPLAGITELFLSRSAVSDSLRPRGLQHAGLPVLHHFPVCSSSCPPGVLPHTLQQCAKADQGKLPPAPAPQPSCTHFPFSYWCFLALPLRQTTCAEFLPQDVLPRDPSLGARPSAHPHSGA